MCATTRKRLRIVPRRFGATTCTFSPFARSSRSGYDSPLQPDAAVKPGRITWWSACTPQRPRRSSASPSTVPAEAADVPNLVAVNGREKMAHWAVGRAQDPGHAGGYIRGMVHSTEPVVGPLVCACAGEVTVGADDQFDVRVQPPFVVFDGCHRCAGWVGHGQAGWTYPIAAMLIVTKKAP